MERARGLTFGTVAEQYDAYRPEPPAAARQLLGAVAGRDVLEVGAGTGLWTRFLERLGARVTAVEPDAALRAVIARRSPGVRVLAGKAEALPLDAAAFDVVLAASAWHWFSQPAATNEVARVLRDRGTLFVLWNGFKREIPWLVELLKLREPPGDASAGAASRRAELPVAAPFDDLREVQLDWLWRRSVEEVVQLFGTYSGVIGRGAAERATLAGHVRRRLAGIADAGVVVLPMTLRGTVARRRPRHGERGCRA